MGGQGCGNSPMVDVSIGVNILEGNMQCLVKLHRFYPWTASHLKKEQNPHQVTVKIK